MSSHPKEIYISVDVETAGPNPGTFSLLSIGACLVLEPAKRFYVELQPVNDAVTAEAMDVSQMDLEGLKRRGRPPVDAMMRFAEWIEEAAAEGRPVFVALNAVFDWMFVADYFHRFLGKNPFGHKALDIKAYFMGLRGIEWEATGFEAMSKHYQIEQRLNHNALEDAIMQAALFRKMLEENLNREAR